MDSRRNSVLFICISLCRNWEYIYMNCQTSFGIQEVSVTHQDLAKVQEQKRFCPINKLKTHSSH